MPSPSVPPGGTVAYVSPASPVAEEKTERMTALLEGAGYRVVAMPNAFAPGAHLAATDALRAADLTDAFLDPEVDGIVCTRGGYGCARLFPWLDLDRLAATGKLFAGFSDVTTLHLALNRRGLPTLHAPMALTLSSPREPWVEESFLRALRGEDPIPPGAPRATTVVPGVAEGVVVGGCLCLLCDSIGTPDALETAGRILLIEDVDEAPHRVDAMLTHLRNAGLLDRVAGIAVGEMTRTDERPDPGIGGWGWREIVRDRLGDLGVPLVTDLPMGHAAQMLTLPLGVPARLDADAGRLTYS